MDLQETISLFFWPYPEGSFYYGWTKHKNNQALQLHIKNVYKMILTFSYEV